MPTITFHFFPQTRDEEEEWEYLLDIKETIQHGWQADISTEHLVILEPSIDVSELHINSR